MTRKTPPGWPAPLYREGKLADYAEYLALGEPIHVEHPDGTTETLPPLADTCARCGHITWHPVRRGQKTYHLSCDPGVKGGPCKYCGQPKTCRRHETYDEDCGRCGWQFAHDCDENDLPLWLAADADGLVPCQPAAPDYLVTLAAGPCCARDPGSPAAIGNACGRPGEQVAPLSMIYRCPAHPLEETVQ